jgi:Na+-transporting NADH:ubiquinone oxidoreductase subunit NqrB
MRPSAIGTAGLVLGLVVGLVLGRLTTVPIWEAATTIAAGAIAAHLGLLWGNR